MSKPPYPHPIKGLGRCQRFALDLLACGDWCTAAEIADGVPTTQESARSAIKGLRGRGFLIETDPNGGNSPRGFKLLPWPDKPWLPVEFMPIYYPIASSAEFTADEARRLTEDHMEIVARRQARAA